MSKNIQRRIGNHRKVFSLTKELLLSDLHAGPSVEMVMGLRGSRPTHSVKLGAHTITPSVLVKPSRNALFPEGLLELSQ